MLAGRSADPIVIWTNWIFSYYALFLENFIKCFFPRSSWSPGSKTFMSFLGLKIVILELLSLKLVSYVVRPDAPRRYSYWLWAQRKYSVYPWQRLRNVLGPFDNYPNGP